MLRYTHPVTPVERHEVLAQICMELVPSANPVYVDVLAESNTEINNCFSIVEDKTRQAGGESQIGWALWELPGLFVEAEFHAVWRSPLDELVDLASKAWLARRILFLPDSVRKYEGCQVNNIRRSTSADPRVVRYLSSFDQEFEIMNRGSRKYQYGHIELSDSEASEMRRIREERQMYWSDIRRLATLIGPYTPCVCSSGKRAKWCLHEPN
jgi:hypothetical protein